MTRGIISDRSFIAVDDPFVSDLVQLQTMDTSC
jgi:hypothetical protein